MDPDSGPLNSEPLGLLALATGHWSLWRGLDPLPTVDEVEAVLGAPSDSTSHAGKFGGAPSEFRRYHPDGSIQGEPIVIWFEADLAVGVQIDRPRRADDDAELAPPDLVIESAYGDRWEQCIWGAAGLVVHLRARPDPDVDGHVDADDDDDDDELDGGDDVTEFESQESGEAALLFALAPFDPDDFLHDALRDAGGHHRRSDRRFH